MPRSHLTILRRDLSTSLPMQELQTLRFPRDRFWPGAKRCQMPSLTHNRFAHRIKDGRVCHTLLPTLNKFEKVSHSPTQRRELKANPDILDLFRNRIPNISHMPMSLKETVAREEASAHGRSSYLPVAEVLFKGLWQCGFVPQLQVLPSSP